MLVSFPAFSQTTGISLEECLELSLNNNPYVRNAAVDVNSAHLQKQEAFSKYFPTVSATAFAFRSFDPMLEIGLGDLLGDNDAAHNVEYYLNSTAGLAGLRTEWGLLERGFLVGVSAVQPVFAGGRIVNGNALAALGVRAATVKDEIARRDNRKDVTAKYWTAVSLAEKKKVLERASDLLAGLEKDAMSARDAGLVVEGDLLQVRLKSSELDAAMRKLKSGERLAKMDLFNAVGLEYKILELDSMKLSACFDDLKDPSSCYRDEAQVAAGMEESELLDLNLQSKQLARKMAIGEALPSVGIGATYGYMEMVGEPRLNGAVFATVRIPISDWGAASRKIRRCTNEVAKARNEKEYLDSQLVLKARKQWMELESAWDQCKIALDAVSLSELRLEYARTSYAAGLATLSELLAAQSELQKCESSLVDCRIAYCNALLDWEN